MDVRATLSGESSLILAIKDKNQALIGYMLREIWNYHGNGATSALIFNNIVYSKFDGLGNTILHALISTKSAVLGYLIAQHRIQEFLTETDSIIIERFVYSIQFEKHFNRMGKFNGN